MELANDLDDLMYQAGMTAQGCWDELDQYNKEAILKLVDLVVLQCIDLVKHSGLTCQHTTFDKSTVDCVKLDAVKLIKKHFNIKENRGSQYAKS